MKTLNGFTKGVNLGGWLSQCDYSEDRLNSFITEKDFDTIALWGLDHVRLPFDYNIFEGGRDGLGLLARAVDMATSRGLNIVLDLHKTWGYSFHEGYGESGFFFDAELQERFCALWEQVAQRFGGMSESVAFELLNEVTDKSYMEPWMKIARVAFERIRRHAPKSKILVGGYWNNAAEAVKDIDAPWDENMVYNFHCYDPMIFTHQHAEWVKSMDVSRDVSFGESGANSKYFEQRFESAISKADRENAYLYCGEYGVIDFAAPEDALKWYKAINSAFTAHGIGRAAWSYRRMNFGLSDAWLNGVRDELIKYL